MFQDVEKAIAGRLVDWASERRPTATHFHLAAFAGEPARLTEEAFDEVAPRNVRRPTMFSRHVRSPARASKAHRAACALFASAAIVVGFVPAMAVRAQSAARETAALEVARFPLNSEAGGVFAPVGFNGRSALFQIDTGSSVAIFDNVFRNELGKAARALRAGTPDGEMRLELFEAPRLTVAAQPAPAVKQVGCVDFSRIRAVYGGEMYGVIGMDFLHDWILRVDFDRGQAALLRSVPEGSGTPVALAVSSLGATATLTVSGIGELPFAVDTGNVSIGSGILEKRVVARLLQSGHAHVAHTAMAESAHGPRRVRRVRVREIALGGHRHGGAVFDEAAINLVGLGYLSRYVVTFDFPGKTMYLKPGARFNEPSRFDLSGAHILRPNGTTTVHSVDRYSAADTAGLKAADVIDQIDSRPAASLTPLQIRKLLCLPGKHPLRITRGKATLDIVLDLKEPPDDWPTPADPPPSASPPRAAEKKTPR